MKSGLLFSAAVATLISSSSFAGATTTCTALGKTARISKAVLITEDSEGGGESVMEAFALVDGQKVNLAPVGGSSTIAANKSIGLAVVFSYSTVIQSGLAVSVLDSAKAIDLKNDEVKNFRCSSAN